MSVRLLARLIRLLPARRRELGEAMLAEAAAIGPGPRRLRWLAGGIWFVVRESPVIWYGPALALAAAALVTVDRIGTSDDSGQVSLAVLLLGSGLLGCAAPRLAWLAGLVLGAALAVANLVYATWGPAPAHPMRPAAAATLLVLIAPALVAAYLGAGLGWLVRRGG